jgi:hypothetical protein
MNLLIRAKADKPPLKPGTVDVIIVSPPYYGCSGYEATPHTWPDGWEGCLGHEITPNNYAAHLENLLSLWSRLLKPYGNLWLIVGIDPSKKHETKIFLDAMTSMVRKNDFLFPYQMFFWDYGSGVDYALGFMMDPFPNFIPPTVSIERYPAARLAFGKFMCLSDEMIEDLLQKSFIGNTEKKVIYDPMAGNGSVVRVAHKLGHIGIGSDMAYLDISQIQTDRVQRYVNGES